VIALGFLLKISLVEWEIIVLAIGIVWIVEAINTVFERLFDLQEMSINPIVKIGKDVSAASVLISAFISLALGILIFLPKIISLIGDSSK
jgi:undecaprenol kinase